MKYSWKDITLGQMQEINSLPEYDNKLTGMIEQLSILKDVDPYDIRKMPVEDMVKEFNEWSFINDTPQAKEVKKLKINGTKYGLINFDEMSLAQLVDIEEYCAEGVIDNAHKILSALYLPYKNIFSKELKDYEPNKELEEAFKSVTMDKIYPTLLFFYLIVQIYLLGSQESLENWMKEVEMEMTKEDQERLEMLMQKLKSELKENGIG